MTDPIPDLARVRAFLRPWCDADVALDCLEVSHVTVGPGGPLRALYEGTGPDGRVLRLVAQRVKAHEGRRLEAEINRSHLRSHLRSHRRPGSGFVQPAIYAPELHLLFQVFPADRRLGGLARAADGGAMARLLEAALTARTGGARLVRVAVHVVRYKPARKCLFRYELTWADGAPRRPTLVYAKLARRTKFERTRDILGRLRAAAGGLDFELPEPLGTVPELCMELFSRLPGVHLFTLVGDTAFPRLCERVGAGLRHFHALPVALGSQRDMAAIVAHVTDSTAEFAALLPAERSRIAVLGLALRAALTALPPPRLGLTHGDFHGDNILVDGTRIGLVDLEDCAMGDPADDVGSNWTQLTWHTLRAAARTPIPNLGRRAFLEAYLERTDAETAARVPTYAAMHSFLYGYQCLRHPQDPARFDDAEAMLGVCEHVLEKGLP
ncbi:MAG: aminoglycoside phosphotransferase family protein [Deltaproteobacteria bacterium]|nr:MAG: aminoglycoside phosphotransferase family protein [Deltaproteobacteria bacterium]